MIALILIAVAVGLVLAAVAIGRALRLVGSSYPTPEPPAKKFEHD